MKIMNKMNNKSITKFMKNYTKMDCQERKMQSNKI